MGLYAHETPKVNGPREICDEAIPMLLRTMTWNIRAGFGNDAMTGERSHTPDLEQIASVIRRVQPDVVALQEVDRFRDRSGYVDQTETLAELTQMDGVFAPNLVDGAGEYGVATLSRLPILEHEHVRFPSVDGWEPRGLLDVLVETEGVQIRIMNTHMQVGLDGDDTEAAWQREDAASGIALRARAAQEPVVVMGDFNADPLSPEFADLQRLTDAWAEQGRSGLTFPSSPVREATDRIDVIFASQRWLVREVIVLDTTETRLASDHFPLVADLRLTLLPT
jgi:endonuclease/exonuclease/phosphatase family metal-dependent hydrolase